MGSKIGEILVTMVLPVFKEVGKQQLLEILSKIETNNSREVYESTVKSLHATFTLLDDVAIKTKTKIDDSIIDVILDAAKEAAEEDGITL